MPEPSERPRVSVIVPTAGRPALLAELVQSLAHCRPPPDEVLVVDQSAETGSVTLVEGLRVETVPCPGTGRGRGVNVGLRRAAHPFALVIDDDMTARSDWVGVAAEQLVAHPERIITGRVLAPEGAGHVPSTIDDVNPRVYRRGAHPGVLYAGNMGARVAAALDIGGFDERIVPSAEDCDFAYRWLRCGREIAYEPTMTTWHHDWRDADGLRDVYRGYAAGQGRFYAKFLRERDPRILRFLLPDLLAAVRVHVRHRPASREPSLEALARLPRATWRGWRDLGSLERASCAPVPSRVDAFGPLSQRSRRARALGSGVLQRVWLGALPVLLTAWERWGSDARLGLPAPASISRSPRGLRLGDQSELEVLIEVFGEHVYGDHLPAHADTIIDLGAHVGFSARYLKSRYPAASVLAVEPNPRVLRRLRCNLADLPGVTVRAVAVDQRRGAAWLHPGQTGSWAAALVREASAGRTVRVPTMTLDELRATQGWTRVDLLKFDIEGAEYDALLASDLSVFGTIVGELHGTGTSGERLLREKLALDFSVHVERYGEHALLSAVRRG